jgi:hypothetical protein
VGLAHKKDKEMAKRRVEFDPDKITPHQIEKDQFVADYGTETDDNHDNVCNAVLPMKDRGKTRSYRSSSNQPHSEKRIHSQVE